MVNVYCDGACEPINPGGMATWGFVVYMGEVYIHEGSGVYNDRGTNNEAEFSAVLNALLYLADVGYRREGVKINTDSRLVVNVLRGDWMLRAENLLPIYRDIKDLERYFRSVSYSWIPRDENFLADFISRVPYSGT